MMTEYTQRQFWVDASNEIDVSNTLYSLGLDGQTYAYRYLYEGKNKSSVKYKISMSDEDYLALKLKFKLSE